MSVTEAMRLAIKEFLENEHVAQFESFHRNMDMAFADGVPQYKKDCEDITAAFDLLRNAMLMRYNPPCNCSWDHVTGSSPHYYCGKCGRKMRS